jgi:protein ImuA
MRIQYFTMISELHWSEEALASIQPAALARPISAPGTLPAHVRAALWHGDEVGARVTSVVSSGHAALDRELPGGGWPCHALTEVLCPQPSTLEWRLLGPALRAVVAGGHQVVVIAPPKCPHLAGLQHEGIDARHLVWLKAENPADRLWCTEQLVRANAAGAVLAWLPQARQEQLRRLQVRAQASDGPVFLFRPAATLHEASPAPLRVMASVGADWELNVNVFKRRGPVHADTVVLPSVPGGLASIITPRLNKPSRLIASEARSHAVDRTPSAAAARHVAPQP